MLKVTIFAGVLKEKCIYTIKIYFSST